MSPVRTITHVTSAEAVKYLEGRVSELVEAFRELEQENARLWYVARHCRLDDAPALRCDICENVLRSVGGMAVCPDCARIYELTTELRTIGVTDA